MELSRIVAIYRNLTLLMAFFASTTLETKTGYNAHNGDKVLTVQVSDQQTWTAVKEILAEDVGYQGVDIWRYPDDTNTADIYVTAENYVNLATDFRHSGIQFKVKITDLGQLIKNERLSMQNVSRVRQKRDGRSDHDIVGIYPTYQQILSWIKHMEMLNPDLVTVVHLGDTYEGRPMTAIKIGIPGSNKLSIWIDGGIHSREWISVTTAIYIADQLIKGYQETDGHVPWYLQTFDFYILPVANPDGFVFCHEHDRLWRKNRVPTSDPDCMGVDLNRNWDIKWGTGSPDAISKKPCEETYIGPKAASELEVQNMAALLSDRRKNFIAYISLHSYSQWFLTRYSYDMMIPEDHEYLLHIAENAVVAMFRVHYSVYVSGTAPLLMYPFSGGSPDWARDKANVTYSYLLELRDRGQKGFVLPQDQIIPTGEEVWAGMEVVFDAALEKFGDVPGSMLRRGGIQAEPIVSRGNVARGRNAALLLLVVFLAICCHDITR